MFSLQISEILISFSGWWFAKFLNMQNHFQSWHKVTNIALIDITFDITILYWYYNIWTRFYLTYVLEESKVVSRKSSIKKVLLKIPQNSQDNIYARVSFAIKLQATGLQFC